MTEPMNLDTVLESLANAISGGGLAEPVARTARRLSERLQSPVRVAIIGPRGMGKSQLVNLFAGRALVPTGLDLPRLYLVWGAAAKTTVDPERAAASSFEGLDWDRVAGAGSASVEQNLPILRKISLAEVSLDDALGMTDAVIDWVTGNADIVLWCSDRFTQADRKLWSRVPDALKDHSFFVLAKADVLSSAGQLPKTIDRLQDDTAEDFFGLYPVATLQALRAMEQQGGVNQATLAASGAKALMTAVLRQVELGRRADLDSALVFLARNRLVTDEPAAPEPARNLSKPQAVTTVKDQAPAAAGGTRRAVPPVVTSALGYLRKRAIALEPSVLDAGPTDPVAILSHCTETANHLVDMFESEGGRDASLAELKEDLLDASELLLLMQLEEGSGPAADAATVLLQIRRGLESRMAA
jgi:hypothetical protein